MLMNVMGHLESVADSMDSAMVSTHLGPTPVNATTDTSLIVLQATALVSLVMFVVSSVCIKCCLSLFCYSVASDEMSDSMRKLWRKVSGWAWQTLTRICFCLSVNMLCTQHAVTFLSPSRPTIRHTLAELMPKTSAICWIVTCPSSFNTNH